MPACGRCSTTAPAGREEVDARLSSRARRALRRGAAAQCLRRQAHDVPAAAEEAVDMIGRAYPGRGKALDRERRRCRAAISVRLELSTPQVERRCGPAVSSIEPDARGGSPPTAPRPSSACSARPRRARISAPCFGRISAPPRCDYLIDEEWARTADDVLWRRTKLGLRLRRATRSGSAAVHGAQGRRAKHERLHLSPSTRARPRAARSSSTSSRRSSARARWSSPSIYPGAGLGRARARGNLGDALAIVRDGADEGRRRRPRTSPRSASPTSARPTIVWDRATGKAIHNAIVWQDRRTADVCARLKARGQREDGRAEDRPAARPLFLRDQDRLDPRQRRRRARSARSRASSPSARSTRFLIWRLTGGKVHATDATNACRTLLFNIDRSEWDDELLTALRRAARDAAGGERQRRRFRRRPSRLCSARAIPIRGVAGDQQAATIGQACFEPGMLKSTYGTGCFALLNTGDELVRVEEPAADDDRLPAQRQDHLCARGRDLHGGRVGAVAARQAAAVRAGVRDATRWREGRSRRSRSISCRPSSGSARRGGMPMRAARSSG